MSEFKFPLPNEFIDLIVTAFDIGTKDKTLNRKKLNIYSSEAEIYNLFDEYVYIPMKEEISHSMADAIRDCFKTMFMPMYKHYIHHNLVNFSRKEIYTLFFDNLCSSFSLLIFNTVLDEHGIPQTLKEITLPNEKSVCKALEWIDSNYASWNAYWKAINENRTTGFHSDKLRLAEWRRGTDIPSCYKIKQICDTHEKHAPHLPWEAIKILLFISRALDFYRDTTLGRNYIIHLNALVHNPELSSQFRQDVDKHVDKKIYSLYDKLTKNNVQDNRLSEDTLNKLDEIFPHGEYKHVRIEKSAEIAVNEGKLPDAITLFKEALELTVYRIGDDMSNVLKRARAVAAMQKNPDLIFLRNIQNINAMYGYDLPSNKSLTKASDKIENWQIKEWRKEFFQLFPDSKVSNKIQREIPHVTADSIPSPDYRYPNKEIRVGNISQKDPQLIWFTTFMKFEIVKKLLEKGADVNKCQKDNGSALLVTLQQSPLSLLLEAEKIFWELAKYSHSKETLNTPTVKKKLLPLHLAINLGRLDIVKKILELGADCNAIASLENLSPLYFCISKIVKQNCPIESLIQPITPETLDSTRRFYHELGGYDINTHADIIQKNNMDIQKYLSAKDDHGNINSEQDNWKQNLKSAYFILNEENEQNKDYYTILKLLLESGADVNQKHNPPKMEGYTPLMFAIEHNNVEIFQLLLTHGGDIKTQFKDLRTNMMVGCLEIATFWKANDIIDVWPTPILI